MRILVIGSDGFIGSHCVRVLSLSHQVVSHPRSDDITAPLAADTYDVCINASGSAHVGFSFEKPGSDFEQNVANVNRILAALKEYNRSCRLINFSSAAVYGNPADLPIGENAATEPVSPYGFHKLQSELLITEYCRFFALRACSLRVFSAYGPGLRKQLFWDIHKKCRGKEKTIQLAGNGDESRDFIFIEDLVAAVQAIIVSAPFAGEKINVASGVETSVKQAVQCFVDIHAPTKNVEYTGTNRTGDPKNWCADISLLRSYGFAPRTSLHEGLKRYSEWLKEHDLG